MGSAGLIIAVIVSLALAVAGFYLYRRKEKGDSARLFAPRSRRLAVVERTALEGGRKLLLVRRDDVEHLILIGGPVDLVLESGIRPEAAANNLAKDASAAPAPFASLALDDSPAKVEPIVAVEPHLPLFPREMDEEKPHAFASLQRGKAAE